MSTETQTTGELTIEQVVTFILNSANADDVSKVFNAGNQRQKTLASIRAAAVTEGAKVRTINIKPKRYEGLEGDVVALERKRSRINATILLTAESTDRIRLEEFIPEGVKRYRLSGIPTSCCKLLD